MRIPGLYIIEQPLFRYKGKEVYKVGYARDSLYKIVRDYKTAYGIIPFKIHLLWVVPSGIVGIDTKPRAKRASRCQDIHKNQFAPPASSREDPDSKLAA